MQLKKTLLALSVSMAGCSFAYAETVVLNNAPFALNPHYEGGLTFQGTQSGGVDPVEANDLTVYGVLSNEATISATGANATGLLVRNTVLGDPNADPSVYVADLSSSGLITANGQDAAGIRVDGGSGLNVINTEAGEIRATGAGSTGLHMSGAKFSGQILNDGIISGEAHGIDIDSSADGLVTSTLKSIDNAGSIIATGLESSAIMIDGATIYSAERGLINTGTIRGGAVGIELGEFTMEPDPTDYDPDADFDQSHFQIHAEKGEISGGQYAIKGGNNRVDLILGNSEGLGTSTIRGDLDGLSLVNVMGPSEFFGSNIDSDLVRINSGASLTLNAAHSVIDGNLDVLQGGTLGMPVSADTQANTPILGVTCVANINSGSSIVVTGKGADFATGGKEYSLIVAAGGLNMANDVTIQSSSALLKVTGFTVENGTLKATVSTGDSDDVSEVIIGGGGNANTLAAGSAFMSVAKLLATSNPNDPVLKALLAAGNDEAAIAKVMKQLVPDVNGGASSAAVNTQALVNHVVGTRNASLRSGQSSGEGFAGTGLWLQALNSNSDQGVRSGIDGYDADTSGFAIGADRELNANTVVGMAYSFAKTDVQSDGGNKTDVESHALTAYGSWTQNAMFVDAALSYGQNQNESKRYVSGTTAEGDYDSDMFGLSVMAGYGFDLGSGMLVEPRVALRYSNLSIDGFKEEGSSAALETGEQRLEVGDIGAGVRFAGSFVLGKGTLEPEVKVMAYHDVIGDKSSTTSAFVLGGSSFVASGATPARDSYEVGVGANYKLGAVTLGASYDRLMKTGFDADSFSAKVRYDF